MLGFAPPKSSGNKISFKSLFESSSYRVARLEGLGSRFLLPLEGDESEDLGFWLAVGAVVERPFEAEEERCFCLRCCCCDCCCFAVFVWVRARLSGVSALFVAVPPLLLELLLDRDCF